MKMEGVSRREVYVRLIEVRVSLVEFKIKYAL